MCIITDSKSNELCFVEHEKALLIWPIIRALSKGHHFITHNTAEVLLSLRKGNKKKEKCHQKQNNSEHVCTAGCHKLCGAGVAFRGSVSAGSSLEM